MSEKKFEKHLKNILIFTLSIFTHPNIILLNNNIIYHIIASIVNHNKLIS